MSCNTKIFSKRWPIKFSEISPGSDLLCWSSEDWHVFVSLRTTNRDTADQQWNNEVDFSFCLQGLFSQLHLHMADSEPVWTFLWKTKQSSFEESQTGLQKDGVRCRCSTWQRTGKIAKLVGNDCLFLWFPSSCWWRVRTFLRAAGTEALKHKPGCCTKLTSVTEILGSAMRSCSTGSAHRSYAHLTALRVATQVSQEALSWITYGGTTLHFLLIQFTLFTPALQTRPSTFIHGTHQGEQIRPWNSVRRGVCKVACRGCSWEAKAALSRG